jgi:hypothetical protein
MKVSSLVSGPDVICSSIIAGGYINGFPVWTLYTFLELNVRPQEQRNGLVLERQCSSISPEAFIAADVGETLEILRGRPYLQIMK